MLAHARELRAVIFRERLLEVMQRRGLSQAGFARATGIDRSTLAQVLSGRQPRLPRAETLVAIAAACGVSADWLLGLSQRVEPDAASFGEVFQIEPHNDMPLSERMFQWMTEAAGTKIRTVPVSFPELLKSPAVLRHEYATAAGEAPARRWESVERRLAYLQRPETEMEACASVQALEELVRGQGVWTGLGSRDRAAQVRRICELSADLYPHFRLFLFDRRRHYTTPFTVFGVTRAALFVGGFYFVFSWTEHIKALVRRFDTLVREAVVQPPDVAAFVRRIARDAGL